MSTIDFGKALQDAKGASFEALPIGDYDIEVAKSEATTSSNGKPMIKVTMKVVAGPYEKRPILNQFVLSLENPQATAIFFRHMKAFGLTEEWFASLGQQQSLEPVASALLGRRARLTVGHREWQGEMRNEVKGVKPYTGAPPATGPGGFSGQAVIGPNVMPPRPPMPAGPTGPTAPVGMTAPLTPSPSPTSVIAPPAAPQVQSVPQPPAPTQPPAAPEAPAPVAEPAVSAVPTEGTSPAATTTPSEPTTATSDAYMPPKLPF